MKQKILLRIAAVLILLHTIGHTFGALSWKNAPNKTIGSIITAMQTNTFDFMGRSVTLAHFYEGYAVILIFVLLFITLLLWLLSNETENPLVQRLLIPLTIFLFLLSIDEYIYFFPFAATISALAAICSLLGSISKKSIVVS